jgi:hypothetical protein
MSSDKAGESAQPRSAQSPQGDKEKRNEAQTQRGSQRDQGSQAQRGKDNQNQAGKSSQDQAQGDQRKGAESDRASGANQTNQAQGSREGASGASSGSASTGAAGSSASGSNVTLNSEQKTRIRETVINSSSAPRVSNVNFALSVGTVVPSSVRFASLPPALIEINPGWRSYSYFVVRDEIVIIDPRTHRIIAILPV